MSCFYTVSKFVSRAASCCRDWKLCAGCREVRYCGAGCQKRAWKALGYHRVECAALQRCAPRLPADSARLLLRIVLRHQVLRSL